MKTYTPLPGLTDRRAQFECIAKIQETIDLGGHDFLAELCVGAGKTNMALGVMKLYPAYKFIIVVPSENIRNHWVEDAKKFGINLSGNYDGKAIRNLFNDGWGDALDGIVITYAVLANNFDLIEQIVLRLNGQVGSFMDEVHHGADGLAWGNAAIKAFAAVVFRIGLTGTPYRHDTAPIPWVKYDKSVYINEESPGAAVPQYHYRYGDGLADKIVAPIDFQWIGGHVERTVVDKDDRDETPTVFDFEDDYSDIENESERTRMLNLRLSAALAANNPMLTGEGGLVVKVVEALIQARQTYERAAAAIVCDTFKQLKVVQAALEKLGVSVKYTTCKEASSDEVVKDFNAGQGDVLLSIKQLAEGVSIPRLQVLGLATTITTQLFFTQIVGRLARLLFGVPYHLQHGTVIAMRDPRFVEYAESFKNPNLVVEQRKASAEKVCPECHALVPRAAKECPECGHEFGIWPPPPPPLEVLTSGQADDAGMTLDGKTYSVEDIARIQDEIEQSNIYSTDAFFASLPRDAQIRLFLAARQAFTV
jgi:superfamily II DNA or RNA helicase